MSHHMRVALRSQRRSAHAISDSIGGLEYQQSDTIRFDSPELQRAVKGTLTMSLSLHGLPNCN